MPSSEIIGYRLPVSDGVKRFARFVIVGGVNTLVGYSLFTFFVFLDMHYSLALFCSTVLGVLFNFKTTGRYVFKNSDNTLIIRFFGTYAVTYMLNLLFLKILIQAGCSTYLSGFLMLLPITIITFILNSRFVFRKVTP
jgi:putative flippase GtrA